MLHSIGRCVLVKQGSFSDYSEPYSEQTDKRVVAHEGDLTTPGTSIAKGEEGSRGGSGRGSRKRAYIVPSSRGKRRLLGSRPGRRLVRSEGDLKVHVKTRRGISESGEAVGEVSEVF